ncbi:MAG: hypothetical protein AAF092_03615 [Pseudomonadota bacterium]
MLLTKGQLNLVAGGAIIIGIVGAAGIFFRDTLIGACVTSSERSTLFVELFKFFLVSSFGGGVLLLLQALRDRNDEAEKERVRSQEKFELRKQQLQSKTEKHIKLHTEFVRIYNQIKRIRRDLRRLTESSINQGSIRFKLTEFSKLMSELNDSQLDLELFSRLSNANQFLVVPSAEEKFSIKKAENFLRGVLSEFENGEYLDQEDGLVEIPTTSKTAVFLHDTKPMSEFFVPIDVFFGIFHRDPELVSPST